MMIHYHGTPITPVAALYQLAGRHFCVSHARPEDVHRVHQIGQSVMLDNGAFSKWKRGAETDWPAFYKWCERWLGYPTTWAVIPDVIDGEVYNKELKTVDYDDYAFVAHINANFPGRADDMEDGGVYKAAESFSFRAGSYGGYNMWRDRLAKLAGYPEGTYEQYGKDYPSYCVACWNGAQGPFAELIHFSDCEGVIGAAISRKLAADFDAFEEAAKAQDDQFFQLYQAWQKAFTMAANGGAVSFH